MFPSKKCTSLDQLLLLSLLRGDDVPVEDDITTAQVLCKWLIWHKHSSLGNSDSCNKISLKMTKFSPTLEEEREDTEDGRKRKKSKRGRQTET